MLNNLKNRFYRFMYGRYGSDTLNRVICVLILISIVATLFLKGNARLILTAITLLLLFYSYFRMFSRNIYKRRKENDAFVHFFRRIKNFPKYKVFTCSQCKTKIRIPRHKGKIEITCPKCFNHFIDKT